MIWKVTVEFEVDASGPDDAADLVFRRLKDSDFEVPPVAVSIVGKTVEPEDPRVN